MTVKDRSNADRGENKTNSAQVLYFLAEKSKAGNHVVSMIGFTEFRAGMRTKHLRK